MTEENLQSGVHQKFICRSMFLRRLLTVSREEERQAAAGESRSAGA